MQFWGHLHVCRFINIFARIVACSPKGSCIFPRQHHKTAHQVCFVTGIWYPRFPKEQVIRCPFSFFVHFPSSVLFSIFGRFVFQRTLFKGKHLTLQHWSRDRHGKKVLWAVGRVFVLISYNVTRTCSLSLSLSLSLLSLILYMGTIRRFISTRLRDITYHVQSVYRMQYDNMLRHRRIPAAVFNCMFDW